MKTSKPISTISYNTDSYLILKLNELVEAKVIEFWCYMSHKAEDDEAGKKDHKHIFAIPTKMVQTADLKPHFQEFCGVDKKPLGVTIFVHSDPDNFILYALHDKSYLASKGQSRKFHYEFDEFITNDPDTLYFLYRQIDLLSLSRYHDLVEASEKGLTFKEYLSRGTVPVQQIFQFEHLWSLINSDETNRNGKPNHD